MKSFRDFFKGLSEPHSPPEQNQAMSCNDLLPFSEGDFSEKELVVASRKLLSEGKKEEAFSIARNLYDNNPNPSREVLIRYILSARATKRFDESLEAARKAFPRFHDDWNFFAEYLQAHICCGSTADLQELAAELTERDPSIPRGWQLRARAAEAVGKFEEAWEYWEKAVNLDPKNGACVFALLQSLIKGGNKVRAKEVYSESKEHLPDDERTDTIKKKLHFEIEAHSQLEHIEEGEEPWSEDFTLNAFSHIHYARYNYDEMIMAARKYVEADPDRFEPYKRLLNALFRSGKYEEGLELCDYLANRFPEQKSALTFLRAPYIEGFGRYGEAIEMLESEIKKENCNFINFVILAQRYIRTGRAEEAYLIMKDATAGCHPLRPLQLGQLASFEMGTNRIDSAIRTIQQMKRKTGTENFYKQFANHASWLAYQLGDMELSRQLMVQRNRSQPYHTLYKSTPPVEVKAAETELPQSRQIRMFTHVYNELSKLKAFLMHYRRLGVDVFYITDNASDDGTHEFLMEQPDVRLFYSDTAFSDSGFGIWWINHLVQRYGAGGWCMHADVDELLVYPNCENIDLAQLTDYMDARGQEALLSYMLDLYPEKMSDVLNWNGQVHPAEVCPFFDDNIHFYPILAPPYQEVWGGFRARVMGDGKGPGQLSNKTPLFKATKEFQLLLGTHYCTPVVPSDVTSACLHFKFIGDVQEIYSKTVEHDQHHDSCFTYKQYLSWLESVELDDDLRAENTHRFTDSSTLLELGLIKTSVQFEEFSKQQKPRFQAGLPRVFILSAPGSSSPEIRQFLRAQGLRGEVESDFPVHTRTDLEDRHGDKQIFVGLAPLHDYQYLYHLIPQAHFILVDQTVVDWELCLQEYCSKNLDTPEPGAVQLYYRNKREFFELRKQQRGIVQSLGQLLEGVYSWKEAGERFNKQVEAFFADKDDTRFAIVRNLTQDGITADLSHLSFLQPLSSKLQK